MHNTSELSPDILTEELTRFTLSRINGPTDLKLLERLELLLATSLEAIDKRLSLHSRGSDEQIELMIRGLEQLGVELFQIKQEIANSNDQILEQDIAVEKRLLALEDSADFTRQEIEAFTQKLKTLPLSVEAAIATLPLERKERETAPILPAIIALMGLQTVLLKPEVVGDLISWVAQYIG